MSSPTKAKHIWMSGWQTDRTVKPMTRTVLYVLYTHMNDHGESCYPTIDQVEYESGMARASVIKHLAIAFKSGWIAKKKKKSQGQQWGNNSYKAVIPEGAACIPWNETEQYLSVKANRKSEEDWELSSSEKGSSSQEEGGSNGEEGSSFQEKGSSNQTSKEGKPVQSVDPSSQLVPSEVPTNAGEQQTQKQKIPNGDLLAGTKAQSKKDRLKSPALINLLKFKATEWADAGGKSCGDYAAADKWDSIIAEHPKITADSVLNKIRERIANGNYDKYQREQFTVALADCAVAVSLSLEQSPPTNTPTVCPQCNDGKPHGADGRCWSCMTGGGK